MSLYADMDDLRRHCRERFEAGDTVARREARRLGELAGMIAADLRRWSALAAALDLGAGFDPAPAARLVMETVFDEALAPPAWRVLADLLAEALA